MATYTGAGGIFTLLGKHMAWFYALAQFASTTTFSSTSNTARFRGLDVLEKTAEAAFAGSAELRAAWAPGKTMIQEQKAALAQMQAAVKGRIDGLMVGPVRAELDGAAALQASAVASALREQMIADGEAVLKNSVALGTVSAAANNIGSARLYVRITDSSGDANELQPANHYTARVTSDELDGVDPGDEQIAIASETSPATLTLVPLYVERSDGNRIVNGCFESASASSAVDWTVAAGTAAHIRVTTTAAKVAVGAQAIQFSANGAVATYRLEQTIGALDPPLKAGVYHFGFDSRRDAGTGTARVKLVGTGFSTPATTITAGSAYADRGGFVVIPPTYPTDLKVRIEFTSTPASGAHLWVDNVTLGEAKVIDGLLVAARRGPTDRRRGDRFDWDTTNDYAGLVQTYFTRWSGWGVRLPSSASASIPDTVAQ